MKTETRAAEVRVGPLTRTDFVRYAGAGGDFNPIHHDDGFAASAGYPSVFGHGLLTAGILSGFACDWLGRRNLRSYGVRYVAQVWPGDTLILSGEITGTTEDGLARAELRVERESPDGERAVVLRGTATAIVSATVTAVHPEEEK
ncbi:MaoC/PaaZ C-terminal domain-containing protein [Actinomadura decatromicini]|uniref:Dihydroxy-acid dehydratase n=1 Tax=Actinomadura decatromicini TaxID=2604572 RepID=A0A5D3F9D6_9ACTN|nr:MaoC/PaaZ C-terminal domain-containing protein [Actinomadura decatromicini]TYK44446.1 dihydroxy-acid dehydratase [Actinomadura decatromicini]